MIKKYILILLSFLLIQNVYAFDIRKINSSKIVSQASYKVNDTNLVDQENAENLFGSVQDLNESINKKEKEIQKTTRIEANLNTKEQRIYFLIFLKV